MCISLIDSARYQTYRELFEKHPGTLGPSGDVARGEIEIALLDTDMQACEAASGRTVGVQYRGRNWMVLHDPVSINGNMDIRERVVPNNLMDGSKSHVSGVAVIPVFPDGTYGLLSTFKHTTRHWHLECIRGSRGARGSEKEAVANEAFEEAGLQIANLERITKLAQDTDVMAGRVAVYRADVVDEVHPRDDDEVIEGIVKISFLEIAKLFLNEGRPVACTVWVKGEELTRDLVCDDPFLSGGLFVLAAKVNAAQAERLLSPSTSSQVSVDDVIPAPQGY
jgi:8-oxo-dGTP pyrophosphatase MutT (NUDIX family)